MKRWSNSTRDIFRLFWALTTCALLVMGASPAWSHPAPFSFVDVRLDGNTLELSVVVHTWDVGYELDIDPPDRVLEPGVLAPHASRFVDLIRERLRVEADGVAVSFDSWSDAEVMAERQSVRFSGRGEVTGSIGVVTVAAHLFPYDPNHQTFINVYEDGALSAQAILDDTDTGYEYFVGTVQGRFAVVARFVPTGIHHILIGPDHLLFLVGLLLLGGTLRQLALVVTGFTLAHSVTLTLAVLGVFSPPARVVEAVIALSIVYVGVDNLMARGGRDVRVWIAVAFGFIHGFGFANVLREMGLPREALGWSLFSFNVGVEIGQLAVVIAVASALTALRTRSHVAAERVVWVGSAVVIAAGAFWFVERVFFPGGIT